MQPTETRNPIVLQPLPGPHPTPSHDHVVRRFSDNYERLVGLRQLAVAEVGSISIIEHISRGNDIPIPNVTFHGRRGPHTGYCQAPRDHYVLQHGDEKIVGWERDKRRRLSEHGMIRLGRLTSLATIAHECGHHLVHLREPSPVPPHGKVWVRWFDVAASGVEDWLGASGFDLRALT